MSAVLWWVALAAAAPLAPGTSEADLTRDQVVITVARDEFDDRFSTADLDAAHGLLVAHLVDTTRISVDGDPCRVGRARVEPTDEGDIRVRFPVLCDPGATRRYHATWLRGRPDGHVHRVRVYGEPVGALTADHPSMEVRMPGGMAAGVPGLLWLAAGLGLLLLGLLGALVCAWWLGLARSSRAVDSAAEP